jgi:hypothetical protein
MKCNWQQQDWPDFRWNSAALTRFDGELKCVIDFKIAAHFYFSLWLEL